MPGIDSAHTADLSATVPNMSVAANAGRGRPTLWAVIAITCAIAAAGIGYIAGHSGGADLRKARTEGARIGMSRGTADGSRRGYREGFAVGRKQGFDKAYKPAYDQAYRQASNHSAP